MSIFKNALIWSAILGFSSAQFIKAVLKRDMKAFKSYGGMPSGHTSMVISVLSTSGFKFGFDSPVFGIMFVLSAIVISDALRVRRKVGMGHSPSEVLAGGILGFFIGYLVSLISF